MKIPEISPQQLPAQHIDPLKVQADVPHNNQTKTIGPMSNMSATDVVKIPSQDRIRMGMQGIAKARFQELAQQIHEIDQYMETVDNQLGEMRASLETIVKQYPPYPPESAERIDNLRRFNALRKVIDQLTIPRQDDGLEEIFKIGKQHLGMGGFDIPDIESNASDDQIIETINKVKGAQRDNQQRREGFLADVHQALDQTG